MGESATALKPSSANCTSFSAGALQFLPSSSSVGTGRAGGKLASAKKQRRKDSDASSFDSFGASSSDEERGKCPVRASSAPVVFNVAASVPFVRAVSKAASAQKRPKKVKKDSDASSFDSFGASSSDEEQKK